MPRRDGAQAKFSRSSKGATKRRTVNKESLKAAKKRGTFIAFVKKKKDRAIDNALRRGDEARAANVIKSADLLHSLTLFARDAKAAGEGVGEGRLLTAAADCLTSMETGENAVDVEENTSRYSTRRQTYFSLTALRGRKTGKSGFVDADGVRDERARSAELRRATAAGERVPRRIGATEVTHKLMLKNEQDSWRSHTKNRRRRVARTLKTAAVATPSLCRPVVRRGAPLQFVVEDKLFKRMPKDKRWDVQLLNEVRGTR